jgi:peptidoglycan/LPS O-acetylase OafA/YrhL
MGEGATELAAPRAPRYYSLDLWRGVACLLVVLKHVTIYAPAYGVMPDEDPDPHGVAAWLIRATSHLWIGVPFFFVISGYCISATADSTRRRGHPLATYFIRRFRRIYPPYWAVIALLVLFVLVTETRMPGLLIDGHRNIPWPGWLSNGQWFGNLTLTESWRAHFGGEPTGYFNTVSWTLCYEEQFYAVVGLLLVLAPRRFFLGGALVTAITVAIQYLVPARAVEGFFFDGYWVHFAAGILVYCRVNYAGRWGARAANLALLAATLLYARNHTPFHGVGPHVGEAGFFACAFALVVSLLHPWDRRLAAASLSRPLMFCGKICYSLYLVHWPVCKVIGHGLYMLGVRGNAATLLVTVPLGVAASVALSWGFFRLVESRFLNSPPSRMARKGAAASETTVAPRGGATAPVP